MDGTGYDVLLHAIKAIKADHVVVVQEERLVAYIKRDCPGITVHQLKRGGGVRGGGGQCARAHTRTRTHTHAPQVVQRSRAVRRHARSARVRSYFYGPAVPTDLRPALSPALLPVDFADLQLLRLRHHELNAEMLPIGSKSTLSGVRVEDVVAGPDLQYSVVALLHCESREEAAAASVVGFLHMCVCGGRRARAHVLTRAPAPTWTWRSSGSRCWRPAPARCRGKWRWWAASGGWKSEQSECRDQRPKTQTRPKHEATGSLAMASDKADDKGEQRANGRPLRACDAPRARGGGAAAGVTLPPLTNLPAVVPAPRKPAFGVPCLIIALYALLTVGAAMFAARQAQ